MTGRSRSGFTLVELLVVMAIIAVLIGVSLPAIQGIRESSRRAQCVVRMTSIGSALDAYEAAHEVLPPGTINPTGPIHNRPDGMHHSWLVQILPYLDESAAYARVNFDVSVYDPRNKPVRELRLAEFICPSEVVYPAAVPGSSYAGCHTDLEAPIDEQNHGLLYLNSHVAYDQITDGRRYTILVGEKLADSDDLGWMSGTRATLRNAGTPLSTGKLPLRPPGTPDTFVGGFGSQHPELVNFLLADGSVRALTVDIDLQRLRQLAHRSDGSLLTWPSEP